MQEKVSQVTEFLLIILPRFSCQYGNISVTYISFSLEKDSFTGDPSWTHSEWRTNLPAYSFRQSSSKVAVLTGR